MLIIRAKMGRPKIENPKGTQVSARMDAETVRKLNYCMERLNLSKAEVLRRGVEQVYAGLKEK